MPRTDPLRNTLDHLALDPAAKDDRRYLVSMLRRLGYTESEIEEALGPEPGRIIEVEYQPPRSGAVAGAFTVVQDDWGHDSGDAGIESHWPQIETEQSAFDRPTEVVEFQERAPEDLSTAPADDWSMAPADDWSMAPAEEEQVEDDGPTAQAKRNAGPSTPVAFSVTRGKVNRDYAVEYGWKPVDETPGASVPSTESSAGASMQDEHPAWADAGQPADSEPWPAAPEDADERWSGSEETTPAPAWPSPDDAWPEPELAEDAQTEWVDDEPVAESAWADEPAAGESAWAEPTSEDADSDWAQTEAQTDVAAWAQPTLEEPAPETDWAAPTDDEPQSEDWGSPETETWDAEDEAAWADVAPAEAGLAKSPEEYAVKDAPGGSWAPEEPFTYGEYTLHTRLVELGGDREQRIYFFAKSQPKSGEPCPLPLGYVVEENDRTGLPFLRRDGGQATDNCLAITQAGTQCRNTARETSKYCAVHHGWRGPKAFETT